MLADSPALYWRLGEAYDDPTAADSSGNNRPGTWDGGRTRVTGLCPDAGYASMVTRCKLTRAREAWMGTASYTAELLVSGGNTASNVAQTYMGIDATGARGWYVGRRAGYLRWESPTDRLLLEAPMTNAPHHAAVTVGSGMIRMYVDGSEVATLAGTPTAPPAGAGFTVADSPYGGLAATIDEVAFHLTALSAARILAHAEAAGLA